MTKTLGLTGDVISLLVQLSLSLRLRGNMRRFRACMKSVVMEKLVVRVGESSAEHKEYREFCLKLFLSRGAHAAKRRMLLWSWLNGGWRNETEIHHWVDPREPRDERLVERISEKVVHGVISALASKPPSTFPRARWTGADLALDEIGLLACVHGLRRHSYLAFLVSCGHKAPTDLSPQPWATPPGEARPPAPAVEDEPQEDENQEELVGAGGFEVPGLAPGSVASPLSDETGSNDVDWAALNAKFRRGGFELIRMRPSAP